MMMDDDQGNIELPSQYRDYAERILASSRHLDGLIRDVLDLAQNQVGELRLVNELLNLREVIEAVDLVGEQLAYEKKLSWNSQIIGELPKVWGDRTRLRQVLLNLVVNAIKFTSDGGISVLASAEVDQITVTVTDTGLGIPLTEQEIIFNEFRQSERTSRRGYGGLGLGLAICKQLVEMHGGQIWAHSSGEEGAGSSFTFTLPTLEAKLSPRLGGSLIAPEQIVMVLSDQSGNGMFIQDQLNRQGFASQVLEVETDDWFSQILMLPVGTIILDLEMKPAREWEIIETLRENQATQDIPVIFCSLSPSDDKGSLLPVDCLQKPVAARRLEHILKQYGFLDQRVSKTILIADDEPGVLDVLAEIIQGAGRAWRVLKARDGQEALSLIRQENPELVILDLLMPELDGFGVLKVMQKDKLLHKIPVIVLTGQSLSDDDMLRLNRGVTAILSKDVYRAEETLAFIVEALDHFPKLGTARQRLARRAAAYIHEHFSERITRDEIADNLGVNKDYLTRCFHAEMGITPTSYLRRFRLNQAKILLGGSDKNITEVALAVGYSDSNYFSRAFREETGMSPSTYRQNQPAS
jgi:AraC-like DNA-binding protein